MSRKLVRREVDLANLPPLTEKQNAELAALAARPDAEIDTSEIPPLTARFWREAARAGQRAPIPHQRHLRREMLAATRRAGGGGFREQGRHDKNRGIGRERGDMLVGASRKR